MKNKVRRWLYDNFRIRLEKRTPEQKRIEKNLNEIMTYLNGEERWFIKLCDSEKDDECPPDYENSR